MPEKPLTEDEALIAALAAVDTLTDAERVVHVSFGRFAASVKPGGCYWSLTLNREAGNTVGAGRAHHDLADGRARERAEIVKEWRRRLVENDEGA